MDKDLDNIPKVNGELLYLGLSPQTDSVNKRNSNILYNEFITLCFNSCSNCMFYVIDSNKRN